MSKYKLYKNIPKQKIKGFLSRSVLRFFDENIIKEDVVNLVVFSTDRSKVVLSGHVRQLMKQKGKLKPLVIIGMMFTSEAADLIKGLTPYFFCYDDNLWDDESYIRIKQGKPLYQRR